MLLFLEGGLHNVTQAERLSTNCVIPVFFFAFGFSFKTSRFQIK